MSSQTCFAGVGRLRWKRKARKGFLGLRYQPVAALIAQVKTHHYRDEVLVRYFEAITEDFRRTKPTEEDYAQINDRIRYWFEERNIDDLIRLDRAIRRQTTAYSLHRKFFLCAFSNILKPTSRWLTKSIKAQLNPDKSPRRVMEAFEVQFAFDAESKPAESFSGSPVPSLHSNSGLSGGDKAEMATRSDCHQSPICHFL